MKKKKLLFQLIICLILISALIYFYLVYWTFSLEAVKRISVDDDYLNKSDQWPFDSFLISNQNYCQNTEKIEILVLIHSSTTHFENRAIIRNYVPSQGLKTLFLIGTPLDKNLQTSLIEESEKFGDMVQGNFHDTYYNLTLKHIMGLTWTLKYCLKVNFVLKTDDDIFINYYLVFQFIDQNFPKLSTDSLFSRTGYKVFACYVHKNMKVIRDLNSKWYVSKATYSNSNYPDFCSGWGYITTPEVIKTILNLLSSSRLFWIDDIFITGILRTKKKDIFLQEINKWFNIDVEYLYQWTTNVKNLFKWRYMFSNTNGDVGLLRSAFEKNFQCFQNQNSCQCCFPNFHNSIENPKFVPIYSTAKVSIILMG